MPEVNVQIGSRSFLLQCKEGEEPHLHAAAKMLDTEASVLQEQTGRLPESRMLLMAGLMLADRFKEVEWNSNSSGERVKSLEEQLRAAESKIAALNAAQPKAFPEAETLNSYSIAIDKLEALAEKLET